MTLNIADLIGQGGLVAVIGILIYIVLNDRKCHEKERREWADMVLGSRTQFAELAEDSMKALTMNQQVMTSVAEALHKLTEALALDRRLGRIEASLGQPPGNGEIKGKEGK